MNRTSAFVVSALLLLAACAGSGNGAADYARAMQYMRGAGVTQDQAKGMEFLLKAADAGHAEAQVAMGYYYLKGTNGVAQDSAKAMEYLTKAAEQGNRDAQYNVGLAYVRGEGTAADFAKAYEWFEKAAYQDDAGAQYNMGVMIINGEGAVADPVAAYVWFRLANEKGHAGAAEGMEAAKNDMTSEQAKEIDREYAKISRKITKPAGTTSAETVPL
ncbi:MAG: sel1 repeat family protein [Candidatus Peribacteraceae bacterium]|nr:sel1 repeat family protein [Candidatus Peribacteraceae bacterium]MBP9850323.1 sel1 repeat family protein [Candidatus Peribacteraceae bacterium]